MLEDYLQYEDQLSDTDTKFFIYHDIVEQIKNNREKDEQSA